MMVPWLRWQRVLRQTKSSMLCSRSRSRRISLSTNVALVSFFGLELPHCNYNCRFLGPVSPKPQAFFCVWVLSATSVSRKFPSTR